MSTNVHSVDNINKQIFKTCSPAWASQRAGAGKTYTVGSKPSEKHLAMPAVNMTQQFASAYHSKQGVSDGVMYT